MTNSRTEKEQIALEVDPEVKTILKEQDGYMWENLQRAVFMAYGGDGIDSISALESELEQVRRDRRDLVEEKHEIEAKIARHKEREANLEDRLEELQAQAEAKEEALERLLEFAMDGVLWPEHAKVMDVAEDHFDSNGKAVLDALVEYAEESDWTIPDDHLDWEGDLE